MHEIGHFYDELADYYHLIYTDWDSSIRKQAESLSAVIKGHFDGHPKKVLDAACGIGTQALGLAQLGYRVSASDVSEAALEKASQFAAERGLSLEFWKADMRSVHEVFSERFDVAIACDNSIPHLLSDEEILEAFKAFHQVLIPGGLAIISVRDYAEMDLGGIQVHPRLVHDDNGVRHVLCDVWEFDGGKYSITIYVIVDQEGHYPEIQAIRSGSCYCVTIDKLRSLFLEAGFAQVDLLKEHYFQPLIVARKAAGA
jgi:SAM-dependent methyltransferase